MLAVIGNGWLVVPAGAGLAVALGDRLATIARLDVFRRIVWRTAPLRGEAWRRSLHSGIVTAAAYNELMLRAARSPSATLGQRLYAARHRAELSIEEAANAAGISTAFLQDAESERPVPPDAAAAKDTLIAQLAMS